MNALGEGRLSITIHAKNAVYNQVSGYIVPRFTCDIFDSVLSTIDEDVATSSKTYDFGAKIVTFSTGNDIFVVVVSLNNSLENESKKVPFQVQRLPHQQPRRPQRLEALPGCKWKNLASSNTFSTSKALNTVT